MEVNYKLGRSFHINNQKRNTGPSNKTSSTEGTSTRKSKDVDRFPTNQGGNSGSHGLPNGHGHS